MFSRKPAETNAPRPRTAIHDGAVQRIWSAFQEDDKSAGARLRKELAETKQERDLLKKFAASSQVTSYEAYFAKESR